MNVHLSLIVNDARFTVYARVCACVGLYRGVDSRSIASMVGLSYASISTRYMPRLVRDGLVGRVRDGRHVKYHERKAGRRLVRSELEALRVRDLETLSLVRASGRGRGDLLDELEGKLKGL